MQLTLLRHPFGTPLTLHQLIFVNYGFALIALILHALAAVSIICGTIARLSGQPLRITDALRDGTGRYASSVATVFLQNLIFYAGLVLLIVPGLIVATRWYVALSVCIVEKRGVIDSFKRSAALTKGHRWKFFGILLVVTFGGAVLLAGVQFLMLRLYQPIASVLIHYVLQLLVLSFGTIVGTTAFWTIRTAKEGPAIETLAEIFA